METSVWKLHFMQETKCLETAEGKEHEEWVEMPWETT